MLQIGNVQLESQTILAPMAGITDKPFRKLCRQFGAGLAISEMVTSDIALWTSEKSAKRLDHRDEKGPISVQIAGSDPAMLAQAAQACEQLGADLVDINMGCPAKKVCKKLAGSALLQDEKLVTRILESVVQSVSIPVTLKTRTGWSTEQKNGVKIAEIAQKAGIAAITMHGRTRACRFNGEAEYHTIRDVKCAVDIPVIANGDIRTPAQAKKVLAFTGADGIMIGRAAFGNPWIFTKINAFLNGLDSQVSIDAVDIISSHFRELYELYGEYKGLRIARKHFIWYCQAFGLNAETPKKFNTLESTQSQLETVCETFEQYSNNEEIAA